MRFLSTAVLGMALAFNVSAEDKVKDKGKVETIDPVTGQKEKTKYKTKGESDGDYKSVEKTESTGPEGKSKSKTRVKADDDGDYKAKTKGKGPDGKYETKTKIDK